MRQGITPVVAIAILLGMTVVASGGAYTWITQVQGEALEDADQELATGLAVRDISCDVSNVTATVSNTGDRDLTGDDATLYLYEDGRLVTSEPVDIQDAGFRTAGGVGTVTALLNTSLNPNHRHRVELAVPASDVTVETTCAAAPSTIDGRWQYRRPVTVTENSGNALSDHQVNWTVDTASLIGAGKMDASCSDLRVWDPVHGTLPHWVEAGCDTGSTMVWTAVPSIPASGERTLYLYYGATGAADASDPEATMTWYDDFDTEREDAYRKTEHRSRGSLTNGGWIWETGESRIRSDTSNSDVTITTRDREMDVSDDILVRADYLFSNDNDGSGVALRDGEELWTGSITNDHGCDGIGSLSGGDVNCQASGATSDVGDPHTFRLASHDGTLTWWVNDSLEATHSQALTVDGVGLLSDAQDGPAHFDLLLARRYVDPQPSVSTGSEERIAVNE